MNHEYFNKVMDAVWENPELLAKMQSSFENFKYELQNIFGENNEIFQNEEQLKGYFEALQSSNFGQDGTQFIQHLQARSARSGGGDWQPGDNSEPPPPTNGSSSGN